jgi:hypothetical protein
MSDLDELSITSTTTSDSDDGESSISSSILHDDDSEYNECNRHLFRPTLASEISVTAVNNNIIVNSLYILFPRFHTSNCLPYHRDLLKLHYDLLLMQLSILGIGIFNVAADFDPDNVAPELAIKK